MNNTKGTTIVSVMAAFVILLLGIAMLFTAVQVSTHMTDRAEESSYAIDGVVDDYYLNNRNIVADDSQMVDITMAGDDGTSFSFQSGVSQNEESSQYRIYYFTHTN